MLKLVLMLKKTELKTIETDKDTITIGRHNECDIHINNLGVSKKHAIITRQNGNYYIEDLNSTNGTLLNNEPVTKASLSGKDVISIGKHTLFVSVNNGQSATLGMSEATIKISP
ncbi:MAG: FHA domain-containing protein [Deltaproteobacteria bacterium]|nr:FHA domain-containing protein [Deltaproteobacteria bacterium]